MKVSVLIPVYRDSDLLESLLNDILSDTYNDKEIFVIIDEPSKKSLKLVEKYRERVNFILNGLRKGKVCALNDAVKKSSGDILLFLDADVYLNNCKNFIEKVVENIKSTDLVEIKKKVIIRNFLTKLVSYDYMSFNFVNWLFSKTLHRCIGINGAAFAIKKKTFLELGGFKRVISEDLYLGMESFLKKKRFKYIDEIEVLNEAPLNWKKWFKQRKRWGYGAAIWFKDYFKDLLKITLKFPQILLPSLIFIFPSLTLLVLIFSPLTGFLEKILVFLEILFATKISVFIPIALGTINILLIMKNFMYTFISFLSSLIIYFVASRILKYRFRIHEFLIYYFIYSFIWLAIIVTSVIKVSLNRKIKLENWKY